MLTTNHQKEALSRSCIHAIAGSAGVNMVMNREFDYGFDGTFREIVLRGTRRVESGYPLDFQLKCTVDWEIEGDNIAYNVETKTWNDLVSRKPDEIGAVLIVVCIPEKAIDWIAFCEESITLRKCCYFKVLAGDPVANEKSTKKILIPRVNLLTGLSLAALIAGERVRRGGGA